MAAGLLLWLAQRSGTLSRTISGIQMLLLTALVENVFVFSVPVQLVHYTYYDDALNKFMTSHLLTLLTIAGAKILQARYTSCHPTSSIKALKERANYWIHGQEVI